MILFFDTETTGFAKFNLPSSDPSQPHLVQLAAILTEDDGSPISSLSTIVKCPVPIPVAASNVHKIDDIKAAALGVDPFLACEMFKQMYAISNTIVGHNISFDIKIMQAAIFRATGEEFKLDKPKECTMQTAKPILQLPATAKQVAAGFGGGFKVPKLEECYKHFFNEDLDGAHDALIDVEATKRVFFHMKGTKDPEENSVGFDF